MKSILCYGDSNTWGYNARTKERFSPDVRWTGILAKELGTGYRVIEEGLNGRTTVWDDPIEGYKNGKEYLIPCLESHRPLDLVIIMLGTNDLKKRFSLSAYDIASGAGVLAEIAMKSNTGYGGNPPRVLLISPILVGDIEKTEFAEMFDNKTSVERSKKFFENYKRIADELGCEFMNAAEFALPSPVDAIHLDPPEHEKLGKAVAAKVKEIIG
ncbi:MAG: SGNH/GDSL hydrolase family protein [Acetivibrionales bacterium]|jgi:lysophospholipase L1-like esterase